MSNIFDRFRVYQYVGRGWTGGVEVGPDGEGDFKTRPDNSLDNGARTHDWSYGQADMARQAGLPGVWKRYRIWQIECQREVISVPYRYLTQFDTNGLVFFGIFFLFLPLIGVSILFRSSRGNY